jgi:tetratricopeptide (TPR) repeat protein
LVNDRENKAYALSGLGLNNEQLGDLDVAAANYEAALVLHNEIGASTLAIFDQAGLARMAMAQGNLQTARGYITPVIGWLLSGNAQKFWDPWIIYLSGYQIAEALGDTDTARSILNEAYTVLHQRAEEISDEDLRRCFLEKVQVNREIHQAWHALHNVAD